MEIIKHYLQMIKIEHTLFALPFSLSGMMLAADGFPSFRIFFWILFCMIFARSGAMGFNRWADSDIDAKNPRTLGRAIPSGKISRGAALLFVVISFALFVFGAFMLNPLTLALSPVPIAVFILYSYTKRFTMLCHFILGLALALSPVGAWIAVQGDLDYGILFLSAGVLSWVSGFDLLYSLQDVKFDVKEGLRSFPESLGKAFTFVTARNLHTTALILFLLNGLYFRLGVIYYAGVGISGVMLIYEHYLVLRYGMRKLDTAFFNMNAAISVVLFLSTAASLLIRR